VAVNLLEKHDIGVFLLEDIPHLGEHKALIPRGEALVDIVCEYLEFH